VDWLVPTWDVMYLYAMAGFSQTMQDKFYGNADLLGRLQIHMRELDEPAGRGLSPITPTLARIRLRWGGTCRCRPDKK
jgi:hypothetical protein